METWVALVKSGNGTMVLTGNNTYTGGTTLIAGALTLGGALPLGSGPVTLGGGTLQATAAGATLANLVTGGGLITGGPGGLTLTAINSYTGGTTINGGPLGAKLPGSLGSGPVTIANAGTLRMGDSNVTLNVNNFGGSGAGWSVQSSGGNTAVSSNVLTLTTAAIGEAGSAFYDTKVPTTNFTASFVYQMAGANPADGVAFVLQNAGPTARGGGGGSPGYTGIGGGAAVEFNVYNGQTIGTNYANNGTTGTYITTGAVNLASGDPILAGLSYNGTTLTETLTDESNQNTFTKTYTANIPVDAGGTSAYVGFTGATGGAYVLQTVSQFAYSSASYSYSNALAVALAANSSVAVAMPTLSMGNLSLGDSGTLSVAPDATLSANTAYTLTMGTTSVGSNATLSVANNGSGTGTVVLGALSGDATTSLRKTGAGVLALSVANPNFQGGRRERRALCNWAITRPCKIAP